MSKNIEVVHISKFDAAKRQLEFAIENFFKNGDIVVTHTLTAASHQILSDIGEKKGLKKSFVMDWSLIKEDKQEELRKLLREAKNFFKHADREDDEKKVLEFGPEQSEFLILDACIFYRTLTSKIIPHIVLFESWMRCKYPHWNWAKDKNGTYEKMFGKIHYSQKEKFLEWLPDLEIAFQGNHRLK